LPLGCVVKFSRWAGGTHIVGTLGALLRKRVSARGVAAVSRRLNSDTNTPPAVHAERLGGPTHFRAHLRAQFRFSKKKMTVIKNVRSWPSTMPNKRAVVRDRISGGASDLLLARRVRDAANKLQASQQVEQLKNDVSRLTHAAKRAASENATLTTRVARLEQALNDACTAPRFEEADAQEKSDAASEPSSESSSGYDAALAHVPVLDRCKKVQQHYDACLAHDDNFNLMTGLDSDVFKRQLAVFTPFIESTTNTGAKATYKLDAGDWLVPLHLQFFILQVHLRHCFTMRFMAYLFGLPRILLPKILMRVSSACERAIKDGALDEEHGGMAFTAESAATQSCNPRQFGVFERMVMIDGMHLVVQARGVPLAAGDKPAHDAALRQLTQPKHACYATMALLGVSWDGRVMHYTTPKAGHEQTLLRNSDFRELCKQFDVTAASDAGLKLNTALDKRTDWCKVVQSVGPGLIKIITLVLKNPTFFTAAEVAHCLQVLCTATTVSQLRIVVENTIAQLRFWACLRIAWRGFFEFSNGVFERGLYSVSQAAYFRIVVSNYNAMRSHRGMLRSADWAPDVSQLAADFDLAWPVRIPRAPKENKAEENAPAKRAYKKKVLEAAMAPLTEHANACTVESDTCYLLNPDIRAHDPLYKFLVKKIKGIDAADQRKNKAKPVLDEAEVADSDEEVDEDLDPEDLGAAWVEDENDSDFFVPPAPLDRIPNHRVFTKSLADRDKANAKAQRDAMAIVKVGVAKRGALDVSGGASMQKMKKR
jgi:hypothetical protein